MHVDSARAAPIILWKMSGRLSYMPACRASSSVVKSKREEIVRCNLRQCGRTSRKAAHRGREAIGPDGAMPLYVRWDIHRQERRLGGAHSVKAIMLKHRICGDRVCVNCRDKQSRLQASYHRSDALTTGSNSPASRRGRAGGAHHARLEDDYLSCGA